MSKKKSRESAVTDQKSGDKSPFIAQKERIKYKLDIRERPDFTERQKVILETMIHKQTKCVFIDGLWGTGKSLLAVLAALKLLNEGKIKQILYVRSPCESSDSATLGTLPGDVATRMESYNAVMMDKLSEILPPQQAALLIKDGSIEFIPPSLLRGRSYNCTAIIVDEAANLSRKDILLILSRASVFTRLFFIGDNYQQDIRNSGFRDIFNTFNDEESQDNGVYTFELKKESDIVRSGFLLFCMKKLGILNTVNYEN